MNMLICIHIFIYIKNSHKCSYAMALISVEMRLCLIFGLMLRLSKYQSESHLNIDCLHQTLVIKTDRDISSTKHPANVSLVLWLTSFAKENPHCSMLISTEHGFKISGNGDIFLWVKIKNSCEDNKQQTNSILQNLWANFNQTWQKETLSKGFSYTNEGPCFYKWEDEIF